MCLYTYIKKKMNRYDEYSRRRGIKFGYPECCIKDYIRRINVNDKFIIPSRIKIKASNCSGFVPCSYCSWKIMSKQCKLSDLITNRKVRTTFPKIAFGYRKDGTLRYDTDHTYYDKDGKGHITGLEHNEKHYNIHDQYGIELNDI